MYLTLSGPHVISSQSVYSVEGLPSGFNVTWSLSDFYYYNNCLQNNTPLNNQCTITRSNGHDMVNDTLVATIKHFNDIIQYVTMGDLYAYAGFKGTYSSSLGSGQYLGPNPIYTASNSVVHVTSPNLIDATVSYYSGDATPTILSQGYNTFDVGMPSTGNTIVVQVNCSNGDIYYIPIIKASKSNNVSVSFDGDMMTITLDEAVLPDQVWTLEVYNVANGEKIVTREVSGNSASINTSGWKRGLYIVCATIGKEVLTEKMQVR